MKYLVIGAGMMGFACCYDLLQASDTEEIILVDCQKETLQTTSDQLNSRKINGLTLDIKDKKAILDLMKRVNVTIGAANYELNLYLTTLAIEAGCHFCDLGGNNTVVKEQFKLSPLAKEAKITVIPDCGLAPGLACNLVMYCIEKMDQVDQAFIRVGGLPQNPTPPLHYAQFFSPLGLMNEYIEPPVIIQNHQKKVVEPMGNVEALSFKGYPKLEAFNTSGGLSTLPDTMHHKIQYLDYKTIRYKGHRDQIKLLMDLGLTQKTPLIIDEGLAVEPKRFLVRLLEQNLPKDFLDVVLIRVQATGKQGDIPVKTSIELIETYDPSTGLTAMMKTTGFHISITAQRLARGLVKEYGILHNELAISPSCFVEEFTVRNIHLKYQEEIYPDETVK